MDEEDWRIDGRTREEALCKKRQQLSIACLPLSLVQTCQHTLSDKESYGDKRQQTVFAECRFSAVLN